MAMVKFRDCLASEVTSQPIINGSLILCRDTGDMYFDTLEGERLTIAKTIHLVQGKVNSELFPENGHIYYSTSDRQICIYNNGEFMPINVATCLKNIDNCYVAKNGNASFNINSEGDKLNSTYGGYIINALPYELSTDVSIYDLNSQLVGNGNVHFNGINHSSGVWSVNVVNSNTSIAWLGKVSVLLMLTTEYQN